LPLIYHEFSYILAAINVRRLLLLYSYLNLPSYKYPPPPLTYPKGHSSNYTTLISFLYQYPIHLIVPTGRRYIIASLSPGGLKYPRQLAFTIGYIVLG
jgi:hypothetical protein